MQRERRNTAVKAAVMLSLALPAAARATETLLDVPGVEIAYYDVAGTDPVKIRAAMAKLGPTDPLDGKRYDGAARHFVRWMWQTDGKLPCTITKADVTMALNVTLPRLADYGRLSKTVRLRWDAFMTGLKAHEAEHLRIALRRRDEIGAALVGAPCASADSVATAISAQIDAANRDFDLRTDHGRKQGYHFP